MQNSEPTIALEADPNDPEDFDATEAEVEAALEERRQRLRGPQKAPTKQQVTLRLDQDVLAYYRGTGPKWHARLNEALRRSAGL